MEVGSLEECQRYLGSREVCKHKETQGQTYVPFIVFLLRSPRDLKGPCTEV